MSPDVAGGLFITVITIIITVVSILFSVVVGLLATIAPIAILYFVFRAMQKQSEQRRALLASGIRGQATVLGLSETGLLINNQPQVTIRLHVRLPDDEPYEATVSQVISMLQIPRLQPGCEVTVVAAPGNPQQVLIDLDQPVQPVVPVATCRYCHRTMPAASTDCPSCGAAV